MHRSRVTGDDSALPTVSNRERGDVFEKSGLFVVGLVAMDIDRPIVFLCQLKDDFEFSNAVFASPLVMRNSADAVGAEFERLFEKQCAVRKRKHSLLRKRDYLNIGEILQIGSQLQQSVKRRQLFIAHVDVSADIERALRDGPFDRSRR